MSVVIIGGNERMEQQYKQICKKYRCKAKVFTRMSGNLKTQIGQPDLIILFTSTVAHKMVHCALKEAERYQNPGGAFSQQQRQCAGKCSAGLYVRMDFQEEGDALFFLCPIHDKLVTVKKFGGRS